MDNHQGQGFMFPSEFQSVASSIQAWPLSAVNPMNPVPDASFFASSHPSNSIYGDLYSPRDSCSGLQFSDCGRAIGGRQSSTEPLGFGGLYNMAAATSSSPFGSLHAEIISKMTAQDIMDAKALVASKSHSEAERRRRERINTHLAKLRSLLPSATKTDKASLLAEVIQHVKELKRQTSAMSEENYPLPTEANELTLDTANENGNFIVKASLCCEDRSDLIPDLIKALKALKLRTLKAEITTLGGRVKNILIVTGEDNDDSDHHQHQQSIVSSIQDALRAVVERTPTADTSSQSAGGGIKRQRTNSLSTIIQETSF